MRQVKRERAFHPFEGFTDTGYLSVVQATGSAPDLQEGYDRIAGKRANYAKEPLWCVPNRCNALILMEQKMAKRKESLQAVPFDPFDLRDDLYARQQLTLLQAKQVVTGGSRSSFGTMPKGTITVG